ncbi:hypothetical protein C0991_008419 [Blastosporella zonata]|nr:hypothetical protein C0991_008419 [Blastosporella zonata]
MMFIALKIFFCLASIFSAVASASVPSSSAGLSDGIPAPSNATVILSATATATASSLIPSSSALSSDSLSGNLVLPTSTLFAAATTSVLVPLTTITTIPAPSKQQMSASFTARADYYSAQESAVEFTTRPPYYKPRESDLDFPVFRKRVYSSRFTIAGNIGNAHAVTMSWVKHTVSRAAAYLWSLDHAVIGNIVFRAAVRSLTPGFDLGLSGSWEMILDDIAASAFAKDPEILGLPAAPSSSTIEEVEFVWPSRLPTLDEAMYGIKWTVAHLDTPAILSLSLRVASAYLDPEGELDTSRAMRYIDDAFHFVFRSHHAPFHRLGEVIKSVDDSFPSLKLPAFVAELPGTLTLDPAEASDTRGLFTTRRRLVRYTRPTPLVKEEPTVLRIYYSAECTHESADFDGPKQHAGHWLSGSVIMDESTDSVVRNAVYVVVSLLACGGVVLAFGKKADLLQGARAWDLVNLLFLVSPPIVPPVADTTTDNTNTRPGDTPVTDAGATAGNIPSIDDPDTPAPQPPPPPSVVHPPDFAIKVPSNTPPVDEDDTTAGNIRSAADTHAPHAQPPPPSAPCTRDPETPAAPTQPPTPPT